MFKGKISFFCEISYILFTIDSLVFITNTIKYHFPGPEAQACNDKAWAFERALGYELADNLYQKTIAKVETRTACIQLCLSEREFTCRSARYDEDSGQCKLSSADRRTEPMKYYGSEDARVSYLENSCLPGL